VPPVPTWRNGRDYLVGYVGVMGQQEGIDLLIDAVAHIVFVKARRDIHFCLVGGGPSLAGLEQLTKSKSLDEFITFTGRVSDEALFEMLSTADVGVNPDRVNPMNNISTMNKILEYLAFSKPIVQFDVVEGRYSAGRASLYAAPNDPVDFADKILYLIDNPAIAAEMGAFGRARFENELSWDYQKPALIDAYVTALKRG
jgi:glycosyltransferase involved in cell wall biosynthesis